MAGVPALAGIPAPGTARPRRQFAHCDTHGAHREYVGQDHEERFINDTRGFHGRKETTDDARANRILEGYRQWLVQAQ